MQALMSWENPLLQPRLSPLMRILYTAGTWCVQLCLLAYMRHDSSHAFALPCALAGLIPLLAGVRPQEAHSLTTRA